MSDMIAALNAVGARRAELTKQLETEAVAILRPLLEGFLKDHPSIEALRWQQYTPYFNDGDTCTFSVGDIEVKATDGDEEAGHYHDGFLEAYVPYNATKYPYEATAAGKAGIPLASISAVCDLSSTLSANEEACLAAFGDHVQVTVTRGGIEVEEYDHD